MSTDLLDIGGEIHFKLASKIMFLFPRNELQNCSEERTKYDITFEAWSWTRIRSSFSLGTENQVLLTLEVPGGVI